MKIKIISYADLREILGNEVVELEVPEGTTIEQLFDFLSEKYGKKFAHFIKDSRTGQLWPFMVLLNDHDVRLKDGGLKTRLNDGDTVTILLPAEGG